MAEPSFVYVLEVGCYEERYIAGVFATAELAMEQHAPKRSDDYRGIKIRESGERWSYEWSGPDEEGGHRFGADWEDSADVTRYEVKGAS